MKTISLLIVLSLFTSCNLFSQTITSTLEPRVEINIVDSIGYDLNKFGDETAQEMSTWSCEKIDWFNTTFCYKRGHFTIPEKPIQDFVEEH